MKNQILLTPPKSFLIVSLISVHNFFIVFPLLYNCIAFKKYFIMIDSLYFIYCSTLSFSGCVIGFYGIMAKHKIEMETRIGMNRGFDFDSDEGNAYFARRYEQWKAGSYFDSQIAPLTGILIAMTGAGLNLIINAWWSSILLLIISYIIYQIAINVLKWKIQIFSILTLIVSIMMITITLI